MNTVTVDTISLRGAGIVTITQPARGHRFTLDSILLADFCRIKPRDRVLEPGCGTGVISLLLAKRHPHTTITAAELDTETADLCRWNVQVNSLDNRVTVLNRNVSALQPLFRTGSFDAIVANPPYGRSGAGRTSPSAKRQIARHGSARDLAAWLNLGRFLRNKGRFFLVFAAGSVAELITELRSRNLEPKRVRWVHPAHDRPSALVLIEALKDGGNGLEIMPPLFVHDPDGGHSPEMKEMYGLP